MYIAPDKKIWTGRNDPFEGEMGHLWHHVIQMLPLDKNFTPAQSKLPVAFLGFACDEGVKRNQGRVGAKDGPIAIRKILASMAVHFFDHEITLHDAGDVACVKNKLEEAQEELSAFLVSLYQKKFLPIVLGGGHEVTFPHFKALYHFFNTKNKTKIGIINLDAHFDMRSYAGGANSGTGFRQIADLCEQNNYTFHYLPIGINKASNIRSMYTLVDLYHIQHITAEEFHDLKMREVKSIVHEFIKKVDLIYLTIDLDVFSVVFAPGVSAPNSRGIYPEDIRPLVKDIVKSGKVISIDFAELNPTYDIDSRTARLAASFVYDVVTTIQKPAILD